MPNLINLVGRRFGTFTVLGRAVSLPGDCSARWGVACDCGAERNARGDLLRAGNVCCASCGDGYIPSGRLLGDTLAEIISLNSEFVTECGCQIWMAALDASGYGRVSLNAKSEGAHRASWMVTRGPIPKGLHVLHRCDTPPCINPDHLFLGTPADNVADMIRKGRQRFANRHLYR